MAADRRSTQHPLPAVARTVGGPAGASDAPNPPEPHRSSDDASKGPFQRLLDGHLDAPAYATPIVDEALRHVGGMDQGDRAFIQAALLAALDEGEPVGALFALVVNTTR